MRRRAAECQPGTVCGPARGPHHQPGTASSPPDVVDGGAEVMGPVSESTVQAVFRAVALCVGLVDADSGLVVAEVVPALGVPRGPVQERAPETAGVRVTRLPPPQPGPRPALSWPVEGTDVGQAGEQATSPPVVTEPPSHCQSGLQPKVGPDKAWCPTSASQRLLRRGGCPEKKLPGGHSWENTCCPGQGSSEKQTACSKHGQTALSSGCCIRLGVRPASL